MIIGFKWVIRGLKWNVPLINMLSSIIITLITRVFFCFHSPHDLSSIRAFMFLDKLRKKVGGPPIWKPASVCIGGGAREYPLER